MQHLTPEEIARLVDEPAAPAEALHLASCLACRRELDAMRAQTRALGSLADPEPRPEAWQGLEARLRAEGLIRTAAPRRAFALRMPARVAASVALFLAGGGAGAALWERVSAGRTETVERVALQPVTPVVRVSPADVVVAPPATGEAAAPAAVPAPIPAPAVARFASDGGSEGGPGGPAPVRRPAQRSPAATAAAAELARTQREYLGALERYAELAAPGSGADDATRLRALNGLVATTQAALDLAPADPVINEYHLGAVEMRDALLRRIARQNESTWF